MYPPLWAYFCLPICTSPLTQSWLTLCPRSCISLHLQNAFTMNVLGSESHVWSQWSYWLNLWSGCQFTSYSQEPYFICYKIILQHLQHFYLPSQAGTRSYPVRSRVSIGRALAVFPRHRQFPQDLLPTVHFNAFQGSFIYSVFIRLLWIRRLLSDSLKLKSCLPLIFFSPSLETHLCSKAQKLGLSIPHPAGYFLILVPTTWPGLIGPYLSHMASAQTEYFLTVSKHTHVCPFKKKCSHYLSQIFL